MRHGFLVTFALLFALTTLANLPGQRMEIGIRTCQEQLLLPPLDEDGRRKMLNTRGFGDSALNRTQQAFVKRAAQRAQRVTRSSGGYRRQPVALEIGMGFGDLGIKVLSKGAFYLGIDMDPRHVQLANERLADKEDLLDSQFHTTVGTFPITPNDSEDLVEYLKGFQQAMEIADIGAFSVDMYWSGDELVQFMEWAFETLPSGGKLYMTGVSPFCNLFPGYEAIYTHRRDVLRERFPGWIPDINQLELAGWDREKYLSMYPAFFHLVDTTVLKREGRKAGFKNIHVRYMRRLYPERLRYRGDTPGVGEIASFIGTKP